MDDAPRLLRSAVALVGAVVLRLALISHQFRTAFGAVGDILQRLAVGFALAQLHTRNLWDNLTALLYIYHISLANIKGCYLVGIVQRSTLYSSASQKHWLKVGYWGDSTCATNLISDLLQSGECLLRLELIRYSPLGSLRR